MEVIWKKPANAPQIERGKDMKVWGLVDFHQYNCKWGDLGEDGKASRTFTLEKVTRRVVELRFSNTKATQDELDYFEDNGEFPASAPGWLDDWNNEDGEHQGIQGFYRQRYEEGGMYIDEFNLTKGGTLQISNTWAGGEPEVILLAWAEFEIPKAPEFLPEHMA